MLFGPASVQSLSGHRALRRIVVIVGSEAISAALKGGIPGERLIAEAIRAARPDVRNVGVDLGTIRWTDPETGRRETFSTPPLVRDALLGLARSATPKPFRFTLMLAGKAH